MQRARFNGQDKGIFVIMYQLLELFILVFRRKNNFELRKNCRLRIAPPPGGINTMSFWLREAVAVVKKQRNNFFRVFGLCLAPEKTVEFYVILMKQKKKISQIASVVFSN